MDSVLRDVYLLPHAALGLQRFTFVLAFRSPCVLREACEREFGFLKLLDCMGHAFIERSQHESSQPIPFEVYVVI